MSLLNDILKQIQGGVAQVNPFDGGRDYRSVTQPRQAKPMQQQALQRRAYAQPIDTAPQGYPATRMPIVGAITDPGVRVAEDSFTFPYGGEYTALPNGRAYVNGGLAEPNSGLQEDNFTFNHSSPTQRSNPNFKFPGVRY